MFFSAHLLKNKKTKKETKRETGPSVPEEPTRLMGVCGRWQVSSWHNTGMHGVFLEHQSSSSRAALFSQPPDLLSFLMKHIYHPNLFFWAAPGASISVVAAVGGCSAVRPELWFPAVRDGCAVLKALQHRWWHIELCLRSRCPIKTVSSPPSPPKFLCIFNMIMFKQGMEDFVLMMPSCYDVNTIVFL